VTGARGADVGVLAAGAVGSGVGVSSSTTEGVTAGVATGGVTGWQAVVATNSAKMRRAARTEPYALSRFKKVAMRSYSTFRCSGSEGSKRS